MAPSKEIPRKNLLPFRGGSRGVGVADARLEEPWSNSLDAGDKSRHPGGDDDKFSPHYQQYWIVELNSAFQGNRDHQISKL